MRWQIVFGVLVLWLAVVGNAWGSVDYVVNTNDSGAGSLRYEMSVASAGDTIQFASNLAGKAITLANALPNITKPLTITGLGASQLTINGGGAYTVFDVASNVTAAISGMTITNGYSTYGDGGGIHNDGNLTISGCNISNNQTLMGEGGGIYNSLNLTVSNCTISNNSIGATGGPSGGGIYFDGSYGGSLTVSNCVFSGNVSESWGGAIYYNGNGNAVGALTVSNSAFSGNSTGYASGGAITVGSAGKTTTISACTFSDNSCIAIVNTGSGSTMAIAACTISGNDTTWGSTAWGGGIYNDSQCTLTLTDSTVSGNTAYVGGGIANLGALIVNDSTVAQNFASDSPGGGGIYASSGTVALANSIVAGNHNGTCPDIYGAVSANNSLIGNTTGAGTISGTGNIFNQDPLLGPLSSNGGPTQTMPLLAGSPAINSGSNALIPSGVTTDQRRTAPNHLWHS